MPEPLETILLVEDNPTTRKLVRFSLEKRGYHVLEAPDGHTALSLMEREPDLILQDIVLPDMDGFSLVSELRARAGSRPTPILAFSGYVSKFEEARISAVGFDDVLIKPIEPAQLVALVEARLPPRAAALDQFGAGKRLLLIDDDPIELKLARLRLAQYGFDVHTAEGAEAALSLARQTRPDVIVSDLTMPGLDGFALAAALRRDPALSDIPLLLVTSSYVETVDRGLALRSGANDLVQKTADSRLLIEALRSAPRASAPLLAPLPEAATALELERTRRALRQLERQVQLNAGLARRCSALAAELTVLAGISETVVNRGELNTALDESLAACFDAGGIPVGALYLLNADGGVSARTLGVDCGWRHPEVLDFFGQLPLLRAVIEGGSAARIPSNGVALESSNELLARSGAKAALLMPLASNGKRLGALFMVTREDDLDQDDWQAFAQGVCNQITQVLTLSAAFAAREAAERKANEQAALLQALIENAPDYVVHVDADGSIHFINRPFPGYSVERIRGTSWLCYQRAEHHRLLERTLSHVLATGEPASYETSSADGMQPSSWFSAHLGPIRSNDRITGAVLLLRDISDRKKAEAQLLLSDRMASVGTLAAGVAHEINNPLASVLANLDMALRSLEKQDGAPLDELRDARAGAERVRHIVRDLKIFSRSEDDARGPVDVRLVLESTLRLASNELRHRAQLHKRYASIPPALANESRLGQVFLNLIINAAQAIPEGRFEHNTVSIETTSDGNGHVVVSISDTGAGIPDDVRSRIFTPFFSTKPIGVGTGLGLSICHRIVTSFGGSISFESEAGKGSVFRVALPAASEQVRSQRPSSVSVSSPSRRGKVLVVDDDEGIGRTVERVLRDDHRVTSVSSGREALTLLDNGESFDVILCDLMMPQMTGMDVYDELRRRHAAQLGRVVFLTGGAFTSRARDFLDQAPNQRLEKPFDIERLRSMVNGFVR
ncbi:MAG: response regulator [Polyangiaceae bacterium]